MVKPANVKLIPHLPKDSIADAPLNYRHAARGEADNIVRLSLLEKRFNHLQMRSDPNHREVHTYNRVCRISSDISTPVGALVNIYA